MWGLTADEATASAAEMEDLALLNVDLRRSIVTLHDVVHAYAAQRLKDEGAWNAAHETLLVAWGDLHVLGDGYSRHWVGYHLHEAGRDGQLAALLFDFDTLRRQILEVGIHRVVRDFEYLQDVPAQEVGHALRRAAHVLAADPELLAQQLRRISSDSSIGNRAPELGWLLDAAGARLTRRSLVPLRPSDRFRQCDRGVRAFRV